MNQPNETNGGAVRILVVDDEPDLETLMRQRFRHKLRDGHYDFVFARNGVEALEVLEREGDIEMVVTDINMPEMDGITLLAKIKDYDARLRAIVVSAYGDIENIRAAMNQGAFDFVTKPIDFQDLEITIEKTIEDVRAMRAARQAHDQLVALEQELDVAKTIQQAMLPAAGKTLEDLSQFEIHGAMEPAKAVGGDFYDFFKLDGGMLGAFIGDVSGKGVPAAIFMALARSVVKSTAIALRNPEDSLRQANTLLCGENTTSVFATLFYVTLDGGRGAYCSAGHNAPFIVPPEGPVRQMDRVGGLVLGIEPETPYTRGELELKPGETLFMYTDGVTEAMREDRSMYGEKRLAETLAAHAGDAPRHMLEAVFESVHSFGKGAPQHDDITALAIRYNV
mgnify:CR=1 FL=1